MRSAVRTVVMGKWTPKRLFAAGQRGGWWDPSDLSTMWQDSAGTTLAAIDSPVGKILDKSGNGNHLTQSTAGARPILRSGGYLDFDGSDDFMIGGDVLDLHLNGMIAVVGVKFDNTGDGGVYAKSIAGSTVGRWGLYRDNSFNQIFALYADSGVHTGNGIDGDTSTATRVYSQRLDRIAGTNDLRRNGVNAGSQGTFTPNATDHDTAYNFRLGAYNNAGDNGIIFPLDGRIYGLIIKQSPSVSSAELTAAESWMGIKAGVPL